MSWNDRKKEEKNVRKQFNTRNLKKTRSGLYSKIEKRDKDKHLKINKKSNLENKQNIDKRFLFLTLKRSYATCDRKSAI